MKAFLRKFLPTPAQTAHKRNQELVAAIAKLQADISQISAELDEIKRDAKNIHNTIGDRNNFPYCISDVTNEIFYANVWNSATASCDWLIDKTFSPSGMAANYSLLYILFVSCATQDQRPFLNWA